MQRKPRLNSIGESKLIWPPHIVPIQLKNFTPVGTAISSDSQLKKGSSTAPVANMWCAQTPIDRAAMASVAWTRAWYPKTGRRANTAITSVMIPKKDEDVHLRVAEPPEEVLPEDGHAAVGSVERGPSRCRSANSKAPAAVRTGNARSTSTLVTTMFQVKIGIRSRVISRVLMVNTVVRTFTPVRIPESPVRTMPAIHRSPPTPGDRTLSDSGVGEPPEVGRPLGGEEPADHHQTAAEVQPVGEEVQPGEGHVLRPDLERHEVVGQTEGERSGEEEHHHAAVHGEQLVERRRADHLAARLVELGSDEQRQDPAEQEEAESRDHVGQADGLVVGARQPADDPGPDLNRFPLPGRARLASSSSSPSRVGLERPDDRLIRLTGLGQPCVELLLG